jgi:hypothetical protein
VIGGEKCRVREREGRNTVDVARRKDVGVRLLKDKFKRIKDKGKERDREREGRNAVSMAPERENSHQI